MATKKEYVCLECGKGYDKPKDYCSKCKGGDIDLNVRQQKMTDFDMWALGIKEQKDTWWGKKIVQHEKDVENGLYGEVLKKWTASSGWLDGVKLSHYIVLRENYTPITIKVSESGAMQKLSVGWGSINKI